MKKPVCFEYIWIDGNNNLRSKNRVLFVDEDKIAVAKIGYADIIGLFQVSKWNFDGSSTNQAEVQTSEVILIPVQTYLDPFLSSDTQLAYFVLCETFNVDGTPHKSNTRINATKIFDKHSDEEPWYGIEQEFFILNRDTKHPLGFIKRKRSEKIPKHMDFYLEAPPEQGPYYCGVGSNSAFERKFVLEVYEKCLKAGLKISGMNGEVAPGQWEIQVGPCVGISAADQLWILRYIMHRCTEGQEFYVEFHAKPVTDGHWNGSGAHTNFSTKAMREANGIDVIHLAIDRLSKKHELHMKVYGDDNDKRMTGQCETSDKHKFSSSVGGRNVSIRIPFQVHEEGKGYLEDRRPSASCDPYLVTSVILGTSCNPTNINDHFYQLLKLKN